MKNPAVVTTSRIAAVLFSLAVATTYVGWRSGYFSAMDPETPADGSQAADPDEFILFSGSKSKPIQISPPPGAEPAPPEPALLPGSKSEVFRFDPSETGTFPGSKSIILALPPSETETPDAEASPPSPSQTP